MNHQVNANALAHCASLIRSNQLDVSFDLASYTLLIYDYLLTSGQEKSLIWPTSWNLAKILFMLNRYIPFLDGLMLIYANLYAQDIPFKTYSVIHEIAGVLIYGGILVAEVIVLFRTWALYGCRPLLGLIFLVFASGLTCGGVYFLFAAVRPSSGVTLRCDLGRSEDFEDASHLFVDYIFLIVHETVMLLLTLYKCSQLLRTKNSDFISSLFKDGILYYSYILAASIVNVCFIKIHNLTGRFVLFQHILHSVFATRILLNLRKAAQRNSEVESSDATSSVSSANRFLSTIVVGVGTWITPDSLHNAPKLPR